MKPYYEDGSVTIYHGDCRSILPMLPMATMLTDPPYGLGLGYLRRDGHGASGGVTETIAGDGDTALAEWTWTAASGSVVIVFADERTWRQNLDAAERSGWAVRTLVWDKMKPSLQVSLRRQYELILVGTRNDHRFAEDRSFTDVIRCLRSEGSGHPTAKPVPLISRVLQFVQPDTSALVLDPFMGSGTTLRAAKDLGRRAIGIELEERYCEIAAERCAQEVLAL